MDNAINFAEAREQPKEIIFFNDGRMTPKNDSKAYYIIKKIFYAFVVILICGSILFREFLFSGESIGIWVCLFIVLGYLKKNGGHERKECPSQLQFFNDYMIFYVPKHHIRVGKDQMEIQKIYYRDVTKCQFRTNTRKYVICGMLDEIHFKYDKQGAVESTPSYQKRYDGMIKFYTVFDYEHDFKEIIERNSSLKVEYQTI